MACYKPLRGYRSPVPNRSGKFGFVFDKSGAAVIPCGRCIGCRIERSRMWAVRCVHEASLYEQNCFITLTYNDECIPPFGSLCKSDLQKFFKRFRKRCGPGIRFYACGEYGEALRRPHYHACVFNFDFVDKELFSVRDGVRLYVSATLNELWSLGFCTVGDVSFESAAYVARYVMKKITGDKADGHYRNLVPETGELVSIAPEFTCMSRGGRGGLGGIGKAWFDRYHGDVYPCDYVVVQGRKVKVPRYYDKELERFNIGLYESIKERRYDRAVVNRPDCTPERLEVREKVVKAQLTNLKRSI